ncbi:MAG: TIR domain-containing protein, partial [Eubacterium sp.]|nr:TIR domain-containing protein [Eubacterium sp.]
RDKAELPITNDLSDNIADALANSDYLIVLCSTNTKESAWVPREIECFLKNHTKREIFTVLVNGEPQDVIPEVLQYIDKVETDENGQERTVRVPIEPLSCDYRMPLKKAKKTELPRLICGLIGCAYDDIMHRQRQHRLRQLTAVFSIALAIVLGFAGYMFYSRTVIHENYMESLRNQSRYLSNESTGLLEKHRRMTALQLALEALPKDDEDDRPVTPEAIRALTEATLAYESNNGTNLHAAWNYDMPNAISDFHVSPDGKTIGILDKGGVVGIWDTQEHKQIAYMDNLDLKINGTVFADDKNFLLWSINTMQCYDTATGEKRWEYTLKDNYFKGKNGMMTAGASIYIATENKQCKSFLEIEVASGKVKSEITLPDKAGYEDFTVSASRLSPDGKKIAFYGLVDWGKSVYGFLDIQTKAAQYSEYIPLSIKNIGWADNNTFLTAGTIVDSSVSASYGQAEYMSTDTISLTCVDTTTFTEKWKTDFTCNGVQNNCDFVTYGQSQVAYFSGNVITLYDLATGQVKYSNNVNSSVVHVSDVDGDGVPIYITENGGYAIPAPQIDADAVRYTRCFADELDQAVINEGVYVRQAGSNEVIYYSVHEYDHDWKSFSTDKLRIDTTADFYLGEQTLAVLIDEVQGPTLHLYELNENGKHTSVKLEGEKTSMYQFLDIYNGSIYLGYNAGKTYGLVTVSEAGGEPKKEDLFEMQNLFEKSCTMADGKLAYITRDDNFKAVLGIRDVAAGSDTTIPLPDDIGYISLAPRYYGNDNIVYVQGETECLVDVAAKTAAKITTPDGWTGGVCASDTGAEGTYAVSDGNSILLTDKSGAVKTSIRCPGVTPLGMTFAESELIVLYSDGGLYWYRTEDGEFVKKTDVYVHHDYMGEVEFTQDTENHLLYIQLNNVTDMVDTQGGVETAEITASFGYHAGRDIFVTAAGDKTDETGIGFYKRYTVEELIEKGREILKDTKLTEEVKSRYGIN